MKIYLNPFRRILRAVLPKDEAFIHSIQIPYELLWDDKETIDILKMMGNTLNVCMGKFDLFNKWALHSCDKKYGKDLNEALKVVYLKPNRQCAACPLFIKCCNIHMDLESLEVLWQEIYATKAEIFKK